MKPSTSAGPGNHAHDAPIGAIDRRDGMYEFPLCIAGRTPTGLRRPQEHCRDVLPTSTIGWLNCSVKSPSELRGKSDFDLFPHNLAQKYRQDDLSVMQTGDLFVDVEENISDGQHRFFEVRKYARAFGNGSHRRGPGHLLGRHAAYPHRRGAAATSDSCCTP